MARPEVPAALGATPGILSGRKYAYQWSSMLIVFYFTEGVVRTIESMQPERLLAITETLLALVFFWSTICFIRQRATSTADALGDSPSACVRPIDTGPHDWSPN